MTLRLRARSILTVASLAGFVVVVLSVLLMWQFHTSTERIRELSTQSLSEQLTAQLVSEAQRTVAQQHTALRGALAAGDIPALEATLQKLVARSDISLAAIHASDGQILASVTAPSISMPQAKLALSPVPETLQHQRAGDHLLIDVPLVAADTRGFLRLGVALEPVLSRASVLDAQLDEVIDRGKRLNWTHVATVGGVSLLCAMGIAMIVAGTLVAPIRRLADYASAVGLGEYSAPLPVDRADELGDLARSLKEMSENLQLTTGEVHYLAYHDSLTQLPNRAQLKQSLRQAIAMGEREGHSVALLFIDLDDFKRVNDTLGHDAGDALLKEFAVRLRTCLRRSDELDEDPEPRETIARLGGDEFTVVLNAIRESDDAGVVARRILEVLREPFVLSGQEVVVGASIGVTVFPEDGGDVDTLLRNADVAMYQAKERGKNHFEFYNDSMHRMATERLSLETDLRHAIEYDQMRIVYQPVLDTQTQQLVAVEAQLRWIHPALGSVLPSVFVPLAEQTGYIVDLDEWVIDQVCTDLNVLRNAGFAEVDISMSLSSMHFREQAITPRLIDAMNRHNVPPARLTLAVSEKTLMRNFESASLQLRELRERGIKAWVNDFGGGHSPLSYLPRMPVAGLRIGSDEIEALAKGDDAKAVIATVIAMAHSLHLKVIATGVENTDQISVLREVGCDFAQGSLYVRPMLLADLMAWLSQREPHTENSPQTGTFGALRMVPPPRIR
ncbi:MAG: putative bifunctional diguanylate cyclase/phosphodiesterase [Gammaproteobacteria bacterium]